MINNAQEMGILLKEIKEEATKAGISADVINEMITKARDVGVKKDAIKICVPIVRVGQKNGINIQRMTTLIAIAIKKATKQISQIRKGVSEKAESEVIEVVKESKIPQMLYGPPPRQNIETVYVEPSPVRKEYVREVPQALYGPPPRQDIETVYVEPSPVRKEYVREVPQALYGPPPRQDIETVYVEPSPVRKEYVSEVPQMLYGPPPRQNIETIRINSTGEMQSMLDEGQKSNGESTNKKPKK